MANAAAVITVAAHPNGNDNTNRHQVKFGTVAVDASPKTYQTNGIPLSFAAASAEGVLTTTPTSAVWGDISGVSGYLYQFDSVRFTVRIYQQDGTTGKLTELGNGVAVPAGVSGDTIKCRLEYNRNI